MVNVYQNIAATKGTDKADLPTDIEQDIRAKVIVPTKTEEENE